MKLAIIDLDGVIADSSARFEQAKAYADENYPGQSMTDRNYRSAYWGRALNGEYVYMDVLVDGAIDHLKALQQDDWLVILLTSRPERMRDATALWLDNHGMPVLPLHCKEEEAQFVKTTAWKAKRVHELAVEHGAHCLLAVDDEAANASAVMNAAPEASRYQTIACSSLLAAMDVIAHS